MGMIRKIFQSTACLLLYCCDYCNLPRISWIMKLICLLFLPRIKINHSLSDYLAISGEGWLILDTKEHFQVVLPACVLGFFLQFFENVSSLTWGSSWLVLEHRPLIVEPLPNLILNWILKPHWVSIFYFKLKVPSFWKIVVKARDDDVTYLINLMQFLLWVENELLVNWRWWNPKSALQHRAKKETGSIFSLL